MPNITIYLENRLYNDFLNLSDEVRLRLRDKFKNEIKRCKK